MTFESATTSEGGNAEVGPWQGAQTVGLQVRLGVRFGRNTEEHPPATGSEAGPSRGGMGRALGWDGPLSLLFANHGDPVHFDCGVRATIALRTLRVQCARSPPTSC